MDIVIVGSGIIGVSAAFYLSRLSKTPGSQIHLIESTPRLFASASGYAGGFLAKDWFSSTSSQLGDLSFQLHKQLAEENDGPSKWGYSPTTTLSMSIREYEKASSGRGEDWLLQGTSRANVAKTASAGASAAPSWITRFPEATIDVLGSGETTAQLDPLKLCEFLVDSCVSEGVQLHHPARPISVEKNVDDELSGIKIKSSVDGLVKSIPCARLLLSCGAWTPKVFRELFPDTKLQIPITSLAGHSILLRSPRLPGPSTEALDGKVNPSAKQNQCHAVFSSIPSSLGTFSPEFFSRVNGEIWFGGLNSSTLPLPDLATAAKVDEESVRHIREVARRFFGSSEPGDADDLEITRSAVCFRPITASVEPILSRVKEQDLGGARSRQGGGVFIAAGHGPWGIALSLGTGKVMAEMMEGMDTSADVTGMGLP